MPPSCRRSASRSARPPRGTCSAGEREGIWTHPPSSRRPAGIANVLTVTYVTVQGTTIGQLFPFLPGAAADTNIGIVALVVNFVVLVVVSFATGGLAVRREQSA